MDREEFTELLDEACSYAVDLYSQKAAYVPSFSLRRVDAEIIKQSKTWPNTTHLKDGYGNWDWQDIWWPNRYKKERFFIAMCEGQNVSALFCGRVLHSASEVRLEYVQRNANALKVKGVVTPVAVTFAAALAVAMEMESVVICDPAPKIVQHYNDHMNGIATMKYKKDVVTAISARAESLIGYE